MSRDFLIVTGACLEGKHTWVTDGGRACEIAHAGGPCASRYPSQPVFVCARCPEIDYGERGGPGVGALPGLQPAGGVMAGGYIRDWLRHIQDPALALPDQDGALGWAATKPPPPPLAQ